MKKVIRLTESDLIRLVKKVIKEQSTNNNENPLFVDLKSKLLPKGFVVDEALKKSGSLKLSKGNDYNGITIVINNNTGDIYWGVTKQGDDIIDKNYKINFNNPNEGKRIFHTIVGDITPYYDIKFEPTQNRR